MATEVMRRQSLHSELWYPLSETAFEAPNESYKLCTFLHNGYIPEEYLYDLSQIEPSRLKKHFLSLAMQVWERVDLSLQNRPPPPPSKGLHLKINKDLCFVSSAQILHEYKIELKLTNAGSMACAWKAAQPCETNQDVFLSVVPSSGLLSPSKSTNVMVHIVLLRKASIRRLLQFEAGVQLLETGQFIYKTITPVLFRFSPRRQLEAHEIASKNSQNFNVASEDLSGLKRATLFEELASTSSRFTNQRETRSFSEPNASSNPSNSNDGKSTIDTGNGNDVSDTGKSQNYSDSNNNPSSSSSSASPPPNLSQPSSNNNNNQPSWSTLTPFWKLTNSDLEVGGSITLRGGSGANILSAVLKGAPVALKRWDLGSRDLPPPVFLSELEMLNKLHHPNLISLIGACAVRGSAFFTMPYYKRGSLAEFLHSHAVGVQKTLALKLKLAIGVASTLDYIHRQNIAHLDVKSPNILISDNFDAILIDLGTTRARSQLETFSKGSHDWMAPETALGNTIIRESDVFSFGLVLWEMISEIYPDRTLQQVVEGKVPALPATFVDHFPEYNSLYKACCQFDPSRRPSMNNVVANLKVMLAKQPRNKEDFFAVWRFVVKGSIYVVSESDIPHISSSIVDLSTDTSLASYSLKNLDPNIAGIDFASNAFSYQAIKSLPNGLTYLNIPSCTDLTDRYMAYLPRTLTHLNVDSCLFLTSKCSSSLPPQLIIFSCCWNENFDDLFVNNLPATIEQLNIASAVSVTDQCAVVLPQNLRKLNMDFNQIWTSDAFQCLPRTLQELHLSLNTSIFPNELSCLPPQLHTLRVGSGHLWNDSSLSSLPRSLQHLHISAPVGKADSFTAACVVHLPPNLTHLSLPSNQSLVDSSIAKLPKNLRYLDLRALTILTDECAGTFPKSITHLDLRSSKEISEAGATLFPPGLVFLNLASNSSQFPETLIRLYPNLVHLRIGSPAEYHNPSSFLKSSIGSANNNNNNNSNNTSGASTSNLPSNSDSVNSPSSSFINNNSNTASVKVSKSSSIPSSINSVKSRPKSPSPVYENPVPSQRGQSHISPPKGGKFGQLFGASKTSSLPGSVIGGMPSERFTGSASNTTGGYLYLLHVSGFDLIVGQQPSLPPTTKNASARVDQSNFSLPIIGFEHQTLVVHEILSMGLCIWLDEYEEKRQIRLSMVNLIIRAIQIVCDFAEEFSFAIPAHFRLLIQQFRGSIIAPRVYGWKYNTSMIVKSLWNQKFFKMILSRCSSYLPPGCSQFLDYLSRWNSISETPPHLEMEYNPTKQDAVYLGIALTNAKSSQTLVPFTSVTTITRPLFPEKPPLPPSLLYIAPVENALDAGVSKVAERAVASSRDAQAQFSYGFAYNIGCLPVELWKPILEPKHPAVIICVDMDRFDEAFDFEEKHSNQKDLNPRSSLPCRYSMNVSKIMKMTSASLFAQPSSKYKLRHIIDQFSQVCQARVSEKFDAVLVLNVSDAFKKQFSASRHSFFAEIFPDFSGGNDPGSAVKYVSDSFKHKLLAANSSNSLFYVSTTDSSENRGPIDLQDDGWFAGFVYPEWKSILKSVWTIHDFHIKTTGVLDQLNIESDT